MKISTTITWVTALVLAGVVSASAQWGGGRPGEPERGPGGKAGHGRLLERIVQSQELAEELGLSEEQIGEFKAMLFDFKEQEIELRAELEKAGIRQARILMAEKVDEKALMEAIEHTGEVRTELAKLRIRPLLVIKETLTPEQLEKAKQMLRERMRDRVQERRRDRGDGDDDVRAQRRRETGRRRELREERRHREREDEGERD